MPQLLVGYPFASSGGGLIRRRALGELTVAQFAHLSDGLQLSFVIALLLKRRYALVLPAGLDGGAQHRIGSEAQGVAGGGRVVTRSCRRRFLL